MNENLVSVGEWNRLQLVERKAEQVRQVIAEHWADDPDRLQDLVGALDRLGFTIPVLYCQGLTQDGDDCGLRLYHDGPCRWR